MNRQEGGFTLIELLVVIAIIGLLASTVIASLNDARGLAQDTVRTQDMKQIRTALEQFYTDNGRYPGTIDGVPTSGQIIGVGNEIDVALNQYINPLPIDPRHDAGTGEEPTAGSLYFYSYDPLHWLSTENCGGALPANARTSLGVIGFNKSEASGVISRDTCHGGHMNLHNADYNLSLRTE
ncbi:MAG: type II secretion system protein G [Candidatus Paceibacteria bacterium]|jgi:type II secretion system protein G